LGNRVASFGRWPISSNEFEPDYKIHPGVTIREYMEWAFAEVTEIPLETLTRLFDGSEPLTPEIDTKPA